MHQTALKVPFQVGTYITVFVISEPETIDNFDDILAATNSSLDFWDNHFDDEDWNYVPTRCRRGKVRVDKIYTLSQVNKG